MDTEGELDAPSGPVLPQKQATPAAGNSVSQQHAALLYSPNAKAVAKRPQVSTLPPDVPPEFSFPGCGAKTRDARNLWTAAYLDSMFQKTRIKRSDSSPCCTWWCNFLMVLLYSPIGAVLVFLRLVLFMPLVGLTFFCVPRCCSSVYLRIISFLLFGNIYCFNGRPSKTARVIVANHTSEMDVLPLRSLMQLRIMGYDFYSKMCWLRMSPLRFFDMLYIAQESRDSEGGGGKRDAVRNQVNRVLSEGGPPLLVFPEGGLTNGRIALLQFHKFLFSLGVEVQPVAIKVNEGPLPIHIDHAHATAWANIIFYLFQPWRVFSVQFLAPQQIDEETDETSLGFAHRVMQQIAAARGMKCGPFLYRDKRRYLRMKERLHAEGFKYQFGPTPTHTPLGDGLPYVFIPRACPCGGGSRGRINPIGAMDPATRLAQELAKEFSAKDGSPLSDRFWCLGAPETTA